MGNAVLGARAGRAFFTVMLLLLGWDQLGVLDTCSKTDSSTSSTATWTYSGREATAPKKGIFCFLHAAASDGDRWQRDTGRSTETSAEASSRTPDCGVSTTQDNQVEKKSASKRPKPKTLTMKTNAMIFFKTHWRAILGAVVTMLVVLWGGKYYMSKKQNRTLFGA